MSIWHCENYTKLHQKLHHYISWILLMSLSIVASRICKLLCWFPKKIIKIVATRCHIFRLKCAKIRFWLGLRPRQEPHPCLGLRPRFLILGLSELWLGTLDLEFGLQMRLVWLLESNKIHFCTLFCVQFWHPKLKPPKPVFWVRTKPVLRFWKPYY